LFEDWPLPQPDGPDNPPVNRSSLDILSRDGSVVGSDVFLYAHLGGTALEGGILPQRFARPQPSGGGGGGGGGPGPPPPPLRGQDYVRFYLDTNESEPGGFDAYGLIVDSYVEVRGRDGRVAAASLYRWSGGAWNETSTTVDAAVGAREVELRIQILFATFNNTRLVAVSGDWSGAADTTSPAGTRTRGGLPPMPLHGGAPLTAIAKPLANIPTIDGNCGSSSNEYEGSDTYTNDSYLKFFVGHRAALTRVYICVEVTADGLNDTTSDWTDILIDRGHNGTGNPQRDDRRFRVAGDGTFTQQRGDAAGGWEACGGSCLSNNTGTVKFNGTSGNERMTYEFNVSFWDTWGVNSTQTFQRAGFAIFAHNVSVDYTWGNDQVSESDNTTWGHLDIPEFESVAAVALVSCILVGLIRRRRRPPPR